MYALKRDFPHLSFFLNGGIKTIEQALVDVHDLDGVMFGRAAYENPWLLREVDAYFRPVGSARGNTTSEAAPTSESIPSSREAVVHAMTDYAAAQVAAGVPLRHVTRHMLSLCNGLPGARRWRRELSDANALRSNDPGLILRAFEHVTEEAEVSA